MFEKKSASSIVPRDGKLPIAERLKPPKVDEGTMESRNAERNERSLTAPNVFADLGFPVAAEREPLRRHMR